MLPADARRLLDCVGQEIARRTGSRRVNRVEEELAESGRPCRDGQTDDHDEALYEDKRDREGEPAGVVVPSAARSRTTASFSSATRPVLRSVLRASSPVSSHVSLTCEAVLMRSPPEPSP